MKIQYTDRCLSPVTIANTLMELIAAERHRYPGGDGSNLTLVGEMLIAALVEVMALQARLGTPPANRLEVRIGPGGLVQDGQGAALFRAAACGGA